MRQGIKLHMGLAEWSMLIVLSILWGGSYFFIEIALTELSPLSIVAIRIFVAAIIMWIIVLASRYPIPKKASVWIAFVWMGLINNVVPFLLITWGQTEIGAGLASILNASAPIFTVIVAGIVLHDEPFTPTKLIGSVIGLVGVAILFGPSAINGLDTGVLAQLAIVGAALAYAISGAYGRRFVAMGVNPIVAPAGQLTASSLILLLLSLAFDAPIEPDADKTSVWLSVLALAVLSTAFAYVLYFRLLERAGATNLLLVTLLIPVTSIILGSLVLGEILHALHFAGMAVIALGLSVIDGRLWSRNRRA